LQDIQAEITRLQPLALRADALAKQTRQARERTQLLDQFRQQTQKDLASLNEVTHILEPPAWTNNLVLTRGDLRITGEGPQAAGVLKTLDGSPFFEKTEIQSAMPSPKGESFMIRSNRRSGK
jgi:hypothetical protein